MDNENILKFDAEKKKDLDKKKEVLEFISELNPDAMFPTDMEEAVIGMMERYGMQPLVLLDKTKYIEILMRDGMTHEQAWEFFDFNVIGAWMGDGTPCFATLNDDLLI